MISYEELKKIAQEKLKDKRFIHTLGVEKRAIEYALIYKVDIETVKLIAIAHDIAKQLTPEEENEYLKKYNIELDEIEKMNHNLLHAKIASYICKYEYGFTDEMCDAVKYHTTGRPAMSLLEKVIYLADATEENRKYSYQEYVDTIKNDINQGMVDVLKWVINDIVNKNKPIHLNTINCYNYYCKEVENEKK